jgi:hypothetical protein
MDVINLIPLSQSHSRDRFSYAESKCDIMMFLTHAKGVIAKNKGAPDS